MACELPVHGDILCKPLTPYRDIGCDNKLRRESVDVPLGGGHMWSVRSHITMTQETRTNAISLVTLNVEITAEEVLAWWGPNACRQSPGRQILNPLRPEAFPVFTTVSSESQRTTSKWKMLNRYMLTEHGQLHGANLKSIPAERQHM